ncbi:aspartate--tRNA ligase [Chondromyces apiculatus]|uniref:Aspartate--tRNA(Asp/Asn) ligase n=1 Tax=Chondromyces apiculatus DSM 436 TaxID=1192034 RepID=A0A017TB94_9BACT|nr:aspartate--tRNA ligase [Chondromyces apiculatus]EYF06533.1 Aspartyl-tRNA synthetase [Chondromyces apiculatus DSM 436]
MSRFIDELKRTHRCGELRASDEGKEVILFGWVASRRDHGGCVFIDIRDREGIAQLVFDPEYAKADVWASRKGATVQSGDLSHVLDAHHLAEQVRGEWVIGIRGVVVSRGQNKNPKIPTGDVEIIVTEAAVFNRAETPPFEITDEIDTREEIRLAYRYLDLRRIPLQRTLRMRHDINRVTRNYLSDQGCLELETPFLVKYTPGGARNFLVPARLSPGKFYALAESPQLYKQLFMVAGFDRYFQIVKCFRDEDLRLDRQPEFTQIDVELSFVNQDDVFSLIEGLVFSIFKDVLKKDLRALYPEGRFPRLPFNESMARYGNDKPDLRFGLEHTDLTELVIEQAGGGVSFWAEIAEKFRSGQYRREVPAEIVKALVIPASANLSRPQLEELERGLKEIKGFKGLARAKVAEDGTWTQSPLAKSITPEARQKINETVGAKAGDVICFQFGKTAVVHTVMAKLRVDIAKRTGLIPEYGHGDQWRFLWVTNPPLFEYDEDTGRWAAAHHAFTRPVDEHIPLLESDPARVECYRYDLVLNGFEIGGGSIRLHDPEVQARVFKTLGIDDKDAREKFGFLLDALKSGAPPHGGIALGMDRTAMLLTGAPTLRDVIPFPKTNQGTDQLTGAPVVVDASQLAELQVKSTFQPPG